MFQVNISELGLVTQGGKVVWGRYSLDYNVLKKSIICILIELASVQLGKYAIFGIENAFIQSVKLYITRKLK